MKYRGTSISAKDRETKIYNFTVGYGELRLLKDLCVMEAKKLNKDILQHQPARNRLKNMIRGFDEGLSEYYKERKELKG